jgi:hypothetical protein
MASLPRPCRLPKRKSVFRAYVPLLGQFERHAAFHDRHRQQSSPASLVAYVEWSWSALQQSRVGLGILIYCPMIRQGLVHIDEIGPPALESSYHIGSRDIVAPLPHPARDPTQRQLGRSESNVDYFDQIALALPVFETLRVVQAAQRTLKGELGPRFDQSAKFSDDHATGRYGCELRAQRRYPTGNQIGINEVNESGNPR